MRRQSFLFEALALAIAAILLALVIGVSLSRKSNITVVHHTNEIAAPASSTANDSAGGLPPPDVTGTTRLTSAEVPAAETSAPFAEAPSAVAPAVSIPPVAAAPPATPAPPPPP